MIRLSFAIAVSLASGCLQAQWVKQPTVGIPRTADGHSRSRTQGAEWEAGPRLFVMLGEDLTYRQIFLDGRDVPKDSNPAWMGYSVRP